MAKSQPPAGQPLSGDDGMMSFSERLLQGLAAKLTGEDVAPEDRNIEEFRAKARNGNPFHLFGAQWPDVVIPPDDRDAPIFRENLRLIETALVTDEIKAACLDPSNPILRLDWWQYIILAAFFDPVIGELFIAGGTGIGKGASVSMAVNLWYDAYEESRSHLTGRDRDHARRNIFGETVKWRTKMKQAGPGRVNSEAISHTERHYVVLLNPDISSATAGEAFSGAHGSNTLYVYDEATSHPSSFVENARRNARLIVALSNPRSMSGWYRSGFKAMPAGSRIAIVSGDLRMRLCMQIGGADCLNCRYKRLKVPVAPKGGLEITEELHGNIVSAHTHSG